MAVLRLYRERVAERRERLTLALQRFVEVCRNDASVIAVYAHGSFVTGKIGPTSDLDLLVVRETDLPRHFRADDLVLAATGDVPLDVLVVTPQEFAERLPTSTFGATILATMRRVDAA
jgi:predicted nucleotidyltransferase